MAASVVVLVAAGALSYALLSAQKIRTGPSEWKTVTLADGSEVTAGPRTQVEINYTTDKRTLRVITGEAMFHVAKNQQRPFYVETELATARAVGTSFAVTETADRTTITVEDGIVSVTSSHHQNASVSNQALRLLAGDQVSVTKLGTFASQHVDPAIVLAWTHQAVIFNDQTIEEAVQEFNKRSRKQIHVLDDGLKRHRVSGMFSAADPDSFASALLKPDQGISIVEKDSDTLLLVPTPEGADKGLRKPQER
jgi:transmembrane sensor